MIKFSATVIWIILLLVGAGVKLFLLRNDPPTALNWLVSQALPANYQIRKDDLRRPPNLVDDHQLPPAENLIGGHLLCDQDENSPIAIQDLSPIPKLPVIGDESFAFVYNLDAGELVTADLLEVGSRVQLCAAVQSVAASAQGKNEQKTPPQTACLNTSIEVLAIHRKTSAAPQDWLMLKVPLQEASEFAKLLAANPRFLLISPKQQ